MNTDPIRLLAGRCMAMEEGAFARVLETLQFADVVRALPQLGTRTTERRQGSLGLVPIVGPLEHRMSFIGALIGAVSTTDLIRVVRQLRDDRDVKAIALLIDSPGGDVRGVPELAQEIRKTTATKPVVALIDGMSASGAYWVASQATQLWMSASSEVGSIGCFGLHLDESRLLDKIGVTPTFVFAGKFKTEGNSLEPLSTDARDEWQRRVDEVYDQFVGDVARGRKVTAPRVRESFGQGRLVGAEAAIARGMADRLIGVHDGLALVAAQTEGRSATRMLSAADDDLAIDLELMDISIRIAARR